MQEIRIEKTLCFWVCFGKYVRDDSDYDFLIQFKDIPFDRYTDNYFSLHEELENLLDREIDLLTENSLNNQHFKDQVINSRLLLYTA
jgi:predicted nucleotidyltransferase